ncbi:substrate-binding domain-containing protein [Rhizobium sp. VS19-DR104.2]|nr:MULTISPECIES: substrate-binding domain-containing protein [unclassified Rhizobium]MBZ5821005.1 substrate-binding domain-containing protein [Rhizobium sp. VS19-DR183]MBZ5763024.1 substrate-binding domain-containing protein [Rhizobium sp. VS19-DR96]MBZ5768803.1 substrate-binding domain-containing protein [Rhizobium sp. VS19-DR129.2]MBZ5776332.1 substrate-binding domain-containing protein [Rhizobium sp. VS19-DRK62.2]MBZ5787540.1 substrate-binding domain-containing protein [Rhizobium sp. VS19-D
MSIAWRIPFVALTALVSTHASAADGATTGPHAERPTPAASVTLTPEEEQKIKDGKFTAALVWHEMSEYTNAVNRGAKDEFKRLGVEVIAQTDAGFDAARQKADVETVLAKKPSIILSLPVDPATAGPIYEPALKAGVKLAFVDNSPKGYVQGRDYVTIVSDDLFQMGNKAGIAMATALREKGKVGYIFHDADFYVTNQRDGAFKATIEHDYPDMKITAQQGMADPARAEEIAQAMVTQNPDLDGIYVTWAEPALSVLSALRAAGNTHTKIVTLDLNEPAALDMVKGGAVAALVADEAYSIGTTVARAAAGSLVGHQAAPFLVVDSLAVTKDTVKEGWRGSLNTDVPATIADALK